LWVSGVLDVADVLSSVPKGQSGWNAKWGGVSLYPLAHEGSVPGADPD